AGEERVGDDTAVGERRRGDGAPLDDAEDDVAVQRPGRVERDEPPDGGGLLGPGATQHDGQPRGGGGDKWEAGHGPNPRVPGPAERCSHLASPGTGALTVRRSV